MQKVGFRGKKWDQSPFSGVVRKKICTIGYSEHDKSMQNCTFYQKSKGQKS